MTTFGTILRVFPKEYIKLIKRFVSFFLEFSNIFNSVIRITSFLRVRVHKVDQEIRQFLEEFSNIFNSVIRITSFLRVRRAIPRSSMMVLGSRG